MAFPTEMVICQCRQHAPPAQQRLRAQARGPGTWDKRLSLATLTSRATSPEWRSESLPQSL